MASRQPESGSSSLDALRKGKEATSGRLKVIHFECDRYDLSADARATLKAHADRLRANPGVNVEIEGHCDERCTTEYNLALGTKRAHATQEYLVSLGIASSRIKTVSYGEELPGCKERDENCYRKNRRDCFVDQRPHPGA
jgi:peptidoglycan-associated lipoprotein